MKVDKLKSALTDVTECRTSDRVVNEDSIVTVREKGGEETKYQLVDRAKANPREGRISCQSPLGRVLLGHRAGDVVTVNAPGGQFTFQIVEVE